MKKLGCSIGFFEYVVVGAKGKAGGICMLGLNALDVHVLEFDSRTMVITI